MALAYGAGVMIQAVKEDGVSQKDITLAFIFLMACHAVVEDTLIFVPLGIPVLPLFLIRLGVAICINVNYRDHLETQRPNEKKGSNL